MKLIILAALAVSGAAFAQPIEMPPPAAATSAKPTDGDTVVCRYEEVTGRRFKERICHTKTQWAALGEFGRSLVEASQQGASAHSCSGGSC